MPPVQSPGLAVDRPASAGSSKGAASAAAVISATSLAMANVFTVEGGDLLTTNGPGKRNGCNTQFSICETSYIFPFFFLNKEKTKRN